MSAKLPVYLDYAATTPVDPRVAKLMCDCLSEDGIFGNPASRSHIYGWKAEEAIEHARAQVAELIHCDPREIVWTSGATESNNLALKGAALAPGETRRHIISSSIEHKAVLDTCAYLETQGLQVTYLKPAADGRISANQVSEALRDDTLLVSVMLVNNEIGAINDVQAIGSLCRENGVLFHVDAAQGLAKIPVDLSLLQVDLMSFSAHKMYGPKGVGALYVRRDPAVKISAQIHGGGHERGMRSGTLPTHQLAGMGEAARIAKQELAQELVRIGELRARFLAALEGLGDIHLNGSQQHCVPGIVSLSIEGVEGEALLMSLRELALSAGSACTSVSVEPSYVLRAIGLSAELAHSSLRISFGRFTCESDIDFAADKVRNSVVRLRELSPRSKRTTKHE
ncbi:MAG: cysteine desulfurase [Lentisphaeria bacterium]|jgi:cysteine desulfurase